MERRRIPNLGRESNSWEVGEPVTRPDGLTVTIHEDEHGYIIHTEGIVGKVTVTDRLLYTLDEIRAIGEGDLMGGVVRAAQASFTLDIFDETRNGTPFDDLFERLDPSN